MCGADAKDGVGSRAQRPAGPEGTQSRKAAAMGAALLVLREMSEQGRGAGFCRGAGPHGTSPFSSRAQAPGLSSRERRAGIWPSKKEGKKLGKRKKRKKNREKKRKVKGNKFNLGNFKIKSEGYSEHEKLK